MAEITLTVKEYPKTYSEFIMVVKERFGLDVVFYKEKAGHIMAYLRMDGQPLCDTEIHGPDAGYATTTTFWAVNVFGWAYMLMPEMVNEDCWVLVKDGMIGWRQGPNSFPEITTSDIDYWDVKFGRTTHQPKEGN